MNAKVEVLFNNALAGTGVIQPVESSVKGSVIEVLCRLTPGQEQRWLVIAEKLLKAGEASGCLMHICRRYIIRNGKMVFGIHLSVDSKTSKAMAGVISNLVLELGTNGVNDEEKAAEELLKPRRVSQEQVRSLTKALPQPPNLPATVRPPPPGFSPAIKLVQAGVDNNGRPTTVEEFPLPHQYSKDRNIPNAKGRGATTGTRG